MRKSGRIDPVQYLKQETEAADAITEKRWADRLVPDIEDAHIVELLEASAVAGKAAKRKTAARSMTEGIPVATVGS